MDLGVFLMPSHPPERELRDALAFNVRVIEWADELGYTEAWLGEHFTAPWEPIPAPDLLIAQALCSTSRIRLAPGAHLLPFHHPAALALRLAQLDHMAAGRLMVGVGAGSVPTDFPLFGIDASTGTHRDMMLEALEIILRLWTEEGTWRHDGRFWTVETAPATLGFEHHLRPFQTPHPPIGIAGLSEHSPSLRLAGERGYIPLSLVFNPRYLAAHWDTVAEGASAAGRTADRATWRIVRDVVVADTDEAAVRLATTGNMARQWTEGNLPLQRAFDFVRFLKHDPDVPDAAVDLDYLSRHLWLVGSPDTVARRLLETYQAVGGFGVLLIETYDHVDDPAVWRESMRLLAEEVMPRFQLLLEHESVDVPAGVRA